MPQFVLGRSLSASTNLQRPAEGVGDFVRGLDRLARHVDGPEHDFLAADELDEVHRDMGVLAFQRDDVDGGPLQKRERLLVLPPFRPEGRLPVGVRLDPVAVADVHGCLRTQPFCRPLQRRHSPVLHLIEEDVECGLVELDDVDPRRLEFFRFLVEDRRELPSQLLAALVVAVVERVDHRHRTGECPLDRLVGLLAEELRVFDEHGPARGSRHRRRSARSRRTDRGFEPSLAARSRPR